MWLSDNRFRHFANAFNSQIHKMNNSTSLQKKNVFANMSWKETHLQTCAFRRCMLTGLSRACICETTRLHTWRFANAKNGGWSVLTSLQIRLSSLQTKNTRLQTRCFANAIPTARNCVSCHVCTFFLFAIKKKTRLQTKARSTSNPTKIDSQPYEYTQCIRTVLKVYYVMYCLYSTEYIEYMYSHVL